MWFVVFEFFSLIFEVRFAGELDSLTFCFSDGVERSAMEARFAIFDFSKVDMIIFGADEVDFVKESFVVFFDDLMAG